MLQFPASNDTNISINTHTARAFLCFVAEKRIKFNEYYGWYIHDYFAGISVDIVFALQVWRKTGGMENITQIFTAK